jgi:hypothetical protein
VHGPQIERLTKMFREAVKVGEEYGIQMASHGIHGLFLDSVNSCSKSICALYWLPGVSENSFPAICRDLFFQSERPLDYRSMAALFVRRRIVSASSTNCLLYLCRARYFPDSS